MRARAFSEADEGLAVPPNNCVSDGFDKNEVNSVQQTDK